MQTLSAPDAEARARGAVEQLAVLAAAAALAESGLPDVATLFAAARLTQRRGSTYGTSSLDGPGAALLLARAIPM